MLAFYVNVTTFSSLKYSMGLQYEVNTVRCSLTLKKIKISIAGLIIYIFQVRRQNLT